MYTVSHYTLGCSSLSLTSDNIVILVVAGLLNRDHGHETGNVFSQHAVNSLQQPGLEHIELGEVMVL